MAAITTPNTSTEAQDLSKPVKVFETESFELLIGRIVRQQIAQQFVDADHPVLSKEAGLIKAATSSLRAHLDVTASEWGSLAWRLRKIVIVRHLRQLAKERIEQHDVDEDVAENALEEIFKMDFEEVFPKGWLDS